MIQILTLILAVVLAPILCVFGFIYGLLRFDLKDKYLFEIANTLDQLANACLRYFLNDTMIKKDGYKFGKGDETISSVFGKNYQISTLTKFGIFWIRLIGIKHCIAAIEINP